MPTHAGLRGSGLHRRPSARKGGPTVPLKSRAPLFRAAPCNYLPCLTDASLSSQAISAKEYVSLDASLLHLPTQTCHRPHGTAAGSGQCCTPNKSWVSGAFLDVRQSGLGTGTAANLSHFHPGRWKVQILKDPRIPPPAPVMETPKQPMSRGRASGQPSQPEQDLRPPKRRRSRTRLKDCCRTCRLRKVRNWTQIGFCTVPSFISSGRRLSSYHRLQVRAVIVFSAFPFIFLKLVHVLSTPYIFSLHLRVFLASFECHLPGGYLSLFITMYGHSRTCDS